LRPKSRPAPSSLRQAFAKSVRAARQNIPAIVALQAAMGLLVAFYYCSSTGMELLSRFGAWQHRGGILGAALASAFAGGLLSEASVVYVQQGGRWTRGNVENTAFKLCLFLLSGSVVYEFYLLQAYWFGDSPSWRSVVPKVLVDQLGFTVLWSIPTQTILTRWHVLRYSTSHLLQELKGNFVMDRMLPVLVMNWMLWIPGVIFIYSMPQNLQMPLCIFGNAIWGLLLSAVSRQSNLQSTASAQDLVLPEAMPEPD
jgi:hypothetical protein